MSAFEKYVEQAAEASWNNDLPPNCSPWDRADEIYKEGARISMRAALAAVGPLIEEDTRDRMVTAAGRAIEREGGGIAHEHPDYEDSSLYCRKCGNCRICAADANCIPPWSHEWRDIS